VNKALGKKAMRAAILNFFLFAEMCCFEANRWRSTARALDMCCFECACKFKPMLRICAVLIEYAAFALVLLLDMCRFDRK